MAQVTIHLPLEETVKEDLEQVCAASGCSVSAAFNQFAREVVRAGAIPFAWQDEQPPRQETD